MSEELASRSKHDQLVRADMKTIANLAKQDIDITSALSDKTVDNMKAFLLIYSRSQLNRVVKLTNALSKLEDKLITQATAADEFDPNLMLSIIHTIQKSLDSALGLIKQVTTDDSYLQVIINSTKVVNNTLNQYNINSASSIPVLSNQDSRDKVRSAVSAILSKVAELEVANGVEVPQGETIELLPEEEE